jgi:predicted methyltransferase
LFNNTHIWQGDKFYVLQFEEAVLGFSEIEKENPAFTTVPDEKFADIKTFVRRIALVLEAA